MGVGRRVFQTDSTLGTKMTSARTQLIWGSTSSAMFVRSDVSWCGERGD